MFAPHLVFFQSSWGSLIVIYGDSCPPSSMLLDNDSAWLQATLPVRAGVLEFIRQFSWHPLHIWPLLLAAQH